MNLTAILDWIKDNWAELTAILGIGGGGIATGKKLTDKKQDQKLQELDDRVKVNEDKVTEIVQSNTDLKKDIETNTKFDKQFRTEINTKFDQLYQQNVTLQSRIDQIFKIIAS